MKSQLETLLEYGLKGCEVLDYTHEYPHCPNVAHYYINGKYVCSWHKNHEPLTSPYPSVLNRAGFGGLL